MYISNILYNDNSQSLSKQQTQSDLQDNPMDKEHGYYENTI